MPKPKQESFDVFKQKKLPALESQAQKFDTARSVRAEQKGVMKNAEMKIREIMMANSDKLDHQEDEHGAKLLVYELGDLKVVVKTSDTVGVRIGGKENDPPAEAQDPEEGGE